MNPIATQVYSGMWIKLPSEIKSKIADIFKIPKNGATHVSNNIVIADGYLDKDLAVLNVENLQKYLEDSEKDIFVLWNKTIEKVKKELEPNKPVENEEKPHTEVNITIDGENVKVAERKVGRPKKNV